MKNKLLRTALSLVTACLLVLAILPQRAEAAGASLSGSSSVQAGNSVTLTLSVDSKILGLTADLNCGDGLTFTNYSCSVSGWSILVNQNHFSVYGTNSASGGIITVTLKVSSSVQGGAALSASFSNIVASDGETDIDVGTASWTGRHREGVGRDGRRAQRRLYPVRHHVRQRHPVPRLLLRHHVLHRQGPL